MAEAKSADTDLKYCRWCKEWKPRAAFHKHAMMGEGILNKCGPCVVKSVAAWRKRNTDCRKKEHQRRMSDPVKKARERARMAVINDKRSYRVPKWLTADDWWMMGEIYQLADLRTRLTGIKWVVDHDIPLLGKRVSGLHVPQNLRVIPHRANVVKTNKYAVD